MIIKALSLALALLSVCADNYADLQTRVCMIKCNFNKLNPLIKWEQLPSDKQQAIIAMLGNDPNNIRAGVIAYFITQLKGEKFDSAAIENYQGDIARLDDNITYNQLAKLFSAKS